MFMSYISNDRLFLQIYTHHVICVGCKFFEQKKTLANKLQGLRFTLKDDKP